MLPRDPDAAVHLGVEVGAQVGGGRGERRRDRGGVGELVAARRSRPCAASHTALVASSVATSMLAQWCFTAWNIAIGRPNCRRSLAYAAAISVHSRARPTASADRITRARSTSTRRAPGSTVAGAPSSVTRAVRRVGSRFVGHVDLHVRRPPSRRRRRHRRRSAARRRGRRRARCRRCPRPCRRVTVDRRRRARLRRSASRRRGRAGGLRRRHRRPRRAPRS